MDPRPTILRIKRRREAAPLDAILVQNAPKRTKLKDAFAKISLDDNKDDEAKEQQPRKQVFRLVSSIPGSEISKTTDENVLQRVNKFRVQLKTSTTKEFFSGTKRRAASKKATQELRSLKRLQQIESKRQKRVEDVQADKDFSKLLRIVDVTMEDAEPKSTEALYESIMDAYVASKHGEETKQAFEQQEEEDSDQFVYDYFASSSSQPNDLIVNDYQDEDEDINKLLERLTEHSGVSEPHIGDIVLSLPPEGESDEEFYDNMFDVSEVDEEDSNREHSDYPEEPFTDDEDEVSTAEDSDAYEEPTALRRADAAFLAYDYEQDFDDDEGYNCGVDTEMREH